MNKRQANLLQWVKRLEVNGTYVSMIKWGWREYNGEYRHGWHGLSGDGWVFLAKNTYTLIASNPKMP